jgi:C4-dicarboxylate-specific signal transduction histidine kinase
MTSVPDRPHILTVRSERLDEWVLISVQDTGTGIVPEQAERMFEAFYTTKPDGIGLGLSISRSIIESHGGRLSASAAHPYGSVFQVLFPTGDRGGGDGMPVLTLSDEQRRKQHTRHSRERP